MAKVFRAAVKICFERCQTRLKLISAWSITFSPAQQLQVKVLWLEGGRREEGGRRKEAISCYRLSFSVSGQALWAWKYLGKWVSATIPQGPRPSKLQRSLSDSKKKGRASGFKMRSASRAQLAVVFMYWYKNESCKLERAQAKDCCSIFLEHFLHLIFSFLLVSLGNPGSVPMASHSSLFWL